MCEKRLRNPSGSVAKLLELDGAEGDCMIIVGPWGREMQGARRQRTAGFDHAACTATGCQAPGSQQWMSSEDCTVR